MKQVSPYLIGLAGQSGAGKNAAAVFLEKKGFRVIDADIIAHAVLQEQKESIITRYTVQAEQNGLLLKKADGSLDSTALGALLFSDPALLAAHEAFIIPKIEERIRTLIRSFTAAAPAIPIVLNAPTLHKTSLAAECAFILYIKAPFLLRLLRCKKRDRISFRRIFARFLHQKNFLPQYLLQNADIVSVKNVGSMYALEQKIEHILQEKGF